YVEANNTSDLLVEPEYYVEQESDGILVRGYIDVFFDSVALIPSGRKVLDWKFGKQNSSHKDQLQLYAYMTGAEECHVVYPKDRKAVVFPADRVKGEEVFGRIVDAGKEILGSGFRERSGFYVEGTPNWTCKRYCGYRDRCP